MTKVSNNGTLQLSLNQLKKVSVNFAHIHKVTPAQMLALAAVNEFKKDATFDQVIEFIQAAWNELERTDE